MTFESDQQCKAKCGLLYLSDCNKPAVDNCIKCNRPICKKHSIKTSQGNVCPECGADCDDIVEEESVSRVRNRSHYYSSYGYYPYYYGTHRYYSDHDYQSFDEQYEVGLNEDFSEINDFSDTDADDFMES
ncbi:MAG: hypothetical protein D6B27_01260 [Gammaproteobacteria bacterium]|nr:MAG: hypothetical protein D6B27_01260 [Gammaproteobacteria bacterium]